jgi:hypothetical protein
MRMPRVRFTSAYCIAALMILLWSMPASAQPVFRSEHDWRVAVDGRLYGLWQIAQFPGGSRTTEVWLGWYSCEIKGPMAEVLALAVLSPVYLMARIDWMTFRRWPPASRHG